MRHWLRSRTNSASADADADDATRVASTTRRSPVYWLIVGGVLLIAAIGIGTGMMVVNFRDRALDSSKRELQNTVMLLTRNFDQQFEELQRVQKSLQAHLSANDIVSPVGFTYLMTSYDTHLMLKARLGDNPLGDLAVIDADGTLVNRTEAWPIADVNFADTDFFKELKANTRPDAELVRSLVSPMTGRWKTVFARKLVGQNGEFLGLVTRGIEPEQLSKFFASVSLGEHSTVGMFHTDGTMLARYPNPDGRVGRNYKSSPLLQRVLKTGQPTTLRQISPVDGIDRIGAVRLLRDFPLALVVTTTVDGALADWRAQTRFLIEVAALSALIIAIMLLLIIRQVARQHNASQAQLELEKQRLDTAINNMSQGLLLFDAQTRVVVANQSYMTMYGLSPDIVRPGCLFRDVIAHRKETGSFDGEAADYVKKVLSKVHLETVHIVKTADERFIQVMSRPVPNGGWVSTHDDITEQRLVQERIAHLAHYDALTDLPNRALFRDQLEHELTRVQRGQHCAVIYIDIDEFKGINDSLGHPVGDELLKAVATRLKGCVRTRDVVARLGGDEFAIVQADIAEQNDVDELIARIYDAIREPFECLGHRLLTDASIGIALAPRDGTDLDELLKNADLAMYGAKADGRRTHRFFEPDMDARVKIRRHLELDLRQAVADDGFAEGGFEIWYQPLLGLHDDAITGCEALLRWRHPERGMISPAEFIPVAEEIGVISQLGEWVLTTACMEAATWPGDVKLAVNVSPVQFRSPALALKVAAALAASGLPARRLELEITEAVLIRDDEMALTILHRLRDLGVRIALDDFGTGYSSLSYLQRFPFDKIKIDRCFITDITAPQGSSSIVQAVVNIATSRNMTTTAEGVETEQQKDLLCRLGCTEMQGYLFSAARPAPQVRELIASHRAKAVAA